MQGLNSNSFSRPLKNELVEFVNKQVIEYKKIRGGLQFVSSIPRNDVGKLLRQKLTKWADEIFDDGTEK